jgi:hypothetical protein
MAMRKVHAGMILTIGITGIVMSVLATSLLTAYQRIPNAGIVKAVGVGVYEDIECSRNVTSIDWGILEPGAIANVTIYIKNEGNTPVMLNMTINNWDPIESSQYVNLSWNREGYVLNPKSVVPAILTLSVSSNITNVTNFSFDIIIIGTECT